MQTNTQGSLQDKFKDFGAEPGIELWGSVAAALDEDKKRRGAIWWWMLGAAAGVALIFSVYQIGYNAGINNAANATVVASEESQENTVQPGENNMADQNTEPFTNQPNEALTADAVTTPANENSQANKWNAHVNGTPPNLQKSHEIPNGVIDQALQETPGEPVLSKQVELPVDNAMTLVDPLHLSFSKMPLTGVTNIASSANPRFTAQPFTAIEKYRKPGQWRVGLNLTAHRNDIGPNAKPDLYNENDTTGLNLSSFDNNPANSITAYKVVTRRPVLAELTVSRSLGRRWGLQSGLGIAFSHSTKFFDVPDAAIYGESAGLDYVKTKHLALHIPLHLTFDFIQRLRVECYSGIGINNELTFWSKEAPTYDNQSLNALSQTEPSKSFDLRYNNSAQFSLGFRYCINEKLKLDLRPNAKWYIKGDKGTWLGLSAGLTWAL